MDLTGRVAKCSCGMTRTSDPDLAFFEYRGADSKCASNTCKHCRYYDVAHTDEVRAKNPGGRICSNFEPIGPYEWDIFYCGCRGWD
jgi:hypothetical protein